MSSPSSGPCSDRGGHAPGWRLSGAAFDGSHAAAYGFAAFRESKGAGKRKRPSGGTLSLGYARELQSERPRPYSETDAIDKASGLWLPLLKRGAVIVSNSRNSEPVAHERVFAFLRDVRADRRLSNAAKLVLWELADSVQKRGGPLPDPSGAELARACGMGRATVFRAVNELKERGLITVQSRAKQKLSAVYQVHWDAYTAPAPVAAPVRERRVAPRRGRVVVAKRVPLAASPAETVQPSGAASASTLSRDGDAKAAAKRAADAKWRADILAKNELFGAASWATVGGAAVSASPPLVAAG